MASPNFFADPATQLHASLAAASQKTPVAPTRASNHALYTSTVAAVRGGKLTEAQGAKALSDAGFPDKENPFTNTGAPGVGGVAHAVAAPLGLSRSTNAAAAAAKADAYAQTHPGTTPAQAGLHVRPNIGVVVPGGGVLPQLLGGAAVKAIYSPAGVYDAATHPVRTAQHIVQQTQHLEHDPAQALFDGLAAATLAAGGAGRMVAAGRAIKEGEGVTAAVTRGTAAGGSLLHQAPPIPRVYKVGSEEVRMLPSRNLVKRGAEEVYDRAARRALVENPNGRLAGHATRRIGKTLEAHRRIDESLQEVSASELKKAGAALTSKRLTPQTKRENLLAIRLAAKNVSAEEQMGYHVGQLGKFPGARTALTAAQSPAEKKAAVKALAELGTTANHEKQIKTLQGIIDRGLLKTDEGGNVLAGEKIARAEALHHEVGSAAEKITEDTGLRTPEQNEARLNAPGRVIAGAKYEAPTPAKLGKPSVALTRQRAQVERLQTLHDRAGSGPRADRIGGALSVAKDRLQSMESSAEKRIKETGIVGGNGARPGRTFVTDKQMRAKRGTALFGRAQGNVVGTVRDPLSPRKPYTGAAEAAGLIPENPIRDTADHYREMVKYANSNEFRQTATRMGAQTKQTDRDVLVSDQELKHPKVPDSHRVALGEKELTTEDLAGHTAGFEDWLNRLIPGRGDKFAEDAKAALGTEAPAGYKWVDQNILGDLAKPNGRLEDVIGKKAANFNDAVNNGTKAAYVYLKLGHFATRYVTNATLNILQGSASPVGIERSIRLFHNLTDRERLQVGALGGQGYVHATFDPAEGAGRISRASGKLAGFGAKFWGHQDGPFRFNAVAYELRKAGFNTDAKVKALLAHPEKYRDQIHDISMRANKENVEYDRLSTKEKQVVARVLWFYPWVKGSTMYAGRFIGEHPLKAAVISNLGTEGENEQSKELGHVPSYEDGLIRTGGSKEFPTTSNPRSLSLFSTPGEVANTGLGFLGGHYGTEAAELGSMFTPALGAVHALAYKQDPFGNAEPHASALHILGQQLFDSAPPVLAFTKLRDLGYFKDIGVNPSQSKIQKEINRAVAAKVITPADGRQLIVAARKAGSNKMFPGGSAREALGAYLAGSWFPRKTNQAQLNTQALAEMSPAERLQAELEQAVKAHVLTPAEAKQFAASQ